MNILPPQLSPGWLQDVWRRANQRPAQPRWPLSVGGVRIGSVAQALMERLVERGVHLRDLGLLRQDDAKGAQWCLVGEPTAALARLAQALRAAGLVRTWHEEALAVVDPAGVCIGAVERGVTRLLGIPVHCIHLAGIVDGLGTWVQQRSMSKAEAPGCWDTLMGGTVAFGESPQQTLERELWEEAGLPMSALSSLHAKGRIRTAHLTDDADGLSYSVDHIDCYLASLPANIQPVNQDGEVLRFDLLLPQALVHRLYSGSFTLEAVCVLLSLQGLSSS